jgi:predicted transcriptional regulator of viral defense system
MYTINGMKTQRDTVQELLETSPLRNSTEFVSAGVDTKTLTRMVEDGEIQRMARGLYAATDYIPGAHHSLIESCKLIGTGVVCLLSALSFHEIGTQNPSQVWIAIPRGTRTPQVEDYPIQVSLFSGEAYSSGIEEHTVDGVVIRVYSIAKTIADCFKYRNKIGLDVAIEALKDVIQNKRTSIDEILRFAKICRVEKVMTPYMESLV